MIRTLQQQGATREDIIAFIKKAKAKKTSPKLDVCKNFDNTKIKPVLPDDAPIAVVLFKQQQALEKFLAGNAPTPLLIERVGGRTQSKYKPGHLPCNTILRCLRRAAPTHFTDHKGCNRSKFADIWLPDGMVKSLSIQGVALWHLKLPCIVFWDFNHFLVVEGLSKERVYLNDPATGRRSVSWKEFSDSYTGVVLVLEPGSGFQTGGRKPGTILSLWSRLQGSVGAMIYCVLTGFLQVIPGLAIPAFSQVFIDNVLIESKNEWLRPLILGMIFTAALNGFLTLLQLQFLRQLKVKLSASMKSKFLWHILRLSISFYDQRFAGEISSRIQLNDSIANLLSGKLATSAIAAASIFLYVIVMLQYDILLTSIAIAFVATNLVTLQWVSRQRTDTNTKMIQEYGKVQGIAISGLQSIETLKASGLESDFFSKWAGHYTKAINIRQQLDVTNQTLGILPTFLSASASMLMLAIGGLRVMDGAMSIGMLVAFQGMMHKLLEPINNLMGLGRDLQDMEGNFNRLDDVLQNPIDPQLEPKTGKGVQGKSSRLPQTSVRKLKLQGDVELGA